MVGNVTPQKYCTDTLRLLNEIIIDKNWLLNGQGSLCLKFNSEDYIIVHNYGILYWLI